jgi:hypothetical protein
MGRKKRPAPLKLISMNIDEELYNKSRLIISNRTKDYEDYLRRRIYAGSRSEMLKMEIEEIDSRREQLMHEYDIEIGLEEKQSEHNQLHDNEMDKAVETVVRIMTVKGVIGLDKLEDIASMQEVSVSDLKQAIPEELHDKFVKFHPQIKEKVGSFR